MDLSPIILSLYVAVIAMFFSVFAGTLLAYFVFKNNKLNGIFDAVITLPMVLPPTVIGFLLLIIFGKNSPLGALLSEFDISVIFTPTAAVISAFIVALPLAYRNILTSFTSIDRDIILSARTLGLSEKTIFFKIILPMSNRAIVAASILSFARAMGEFGATIMVAGNIPGKTQTVSIRIYSLIQAGNFNEAYLYVGFMMGISFLFILLVNILSKRNIGNELTKESY